MSVSVTYSYEDEAVVKVFQKIIINNILYIVYKTDHVIIVAIDPNTLVIHDNYHIKNSVTDAHITPDDMIILLSYYQHIYIYDSFDKLKENYPEDLDLLI